MNSVISTEKYDEILALLREVGLEVINKRASPDFWIQTKEDESLVTNVDFWANTVISERLQNLFPNDFILGEESENKSYPIGAERIWYVDPIDGTKQFTKGEDHFYILIGLAVNGIPTLGFCYKPVEKLLLFTREHQFEAYKNGKKIEVPELSWNSSSSLVQKYVSPEQKKEILEKFGKTKEPYIVNMVSQLGPIFGKSCGYIGFRRTHYWDLCAPAAIMKSLGFDHEYFHSNGEKATLNDGSIKCRAYYALPKSTPKELKSWFENQIEGLPEEE